MIHTFVKGEPNWVDPLNANFQEVATTAGGAIPASEKGAAGGVATLNSAGKLAQMPTAADVGAEVQSGINSNGSWMKWPDGTMICSTFRDAAIDSKYESTYYSPGWVFPETYISPPVLSITPAAAYGGDLFVEYSSVTNTSTGPATLKNPIASITVNTTKLMYYIVAIGRWK